MNWEDRALVISPVRYCLCADEKRFRKTLKALRVPKSEWPNFVGSTRSDAAAHFLETGEGEVCVIVTIAGHKKRPLPQVHALLVHEAVHIWQEIRSIIGEKEPSSEFEAYSIQSISQRLMESYAQQVKK